MTAAPRAAFRLTIRQKLLAVIVPLMVGVVGFLTVFFSTQTLDHMAVDLHRRAEIYGDLVRGQVASSVAFADRQTAREVLASLDSDPDVSAVVLYGARGVRLYAHGVAEAWALRGAATEVDAATVVDTQGHVSALVPIHSLEGPRGTLVIQLSTATLEAQRRHVLWTAAGVGGGAIVVAALIAWAIARRFARRLDRIARVARRTAGGDMTGVVGDRAGDELGETARAFDGMVARLGELMAERELAAHREQERLAALVDARTAELDARNAELRMVFDHIDQGFLTVALDGTIACERSAVVERWLGPIEDRSFIDYVRSFAPQAADWFELSWGQLVRGELPAELCLAQLPSQFEVQGRHIQMSFKALPDRVLVVVSDATAEAERERANRDERETTALLAHMLRDRAGFLAFCGEANRLALGISATRDFTAASFAHDVHTLKGIAALEHVASISELCHELENGLAEADELGTARRCVAIGARWRFLKSKIEPIADSARERVDVTAAELDHLENEIASGASRVDLAAQVARLRSERVLPRIEQLAEQARLVATRLCKDPLVVWIDVDPELRVPAERWRPVWAALVHAVRNAVDHGLESPPERARLGKSETATIALSAHRDRDELVFAIEDRGRGVDWDRIAEVGRARGLPVGTHAELVAAMFSDGVSTRTEITDVSGRGVGMAALRAACEATGGRISVESKRGKGTRLEIAWPVQAAAPLPYQAAS